MTWGKVDVVVVLNLTLRFTTAPARPAEDTTQANCAAEVTSPNTNKDPGARTTKWTKWTSTTTTSTSGTRTSNTTHLLQQAGRAVLLAAGGVRQQVTPICPLSEHASICTCCHGQQHRGCQQHQHGNLQGVTVAAVVLGRKTTSGGAACCWVCSVAASTVLKRTCPRAIGSLFGGNECNND